MDVVNRQPRPAVGRQAGTKHHFLQLRLAHLGHHGHGQRVGALRVQRQKHCIVIPAAGQAQLRVQQLRLVVDRARGQARQAARAIGVVALVAVHAQRAKAVQRARVVGHAQARLVLVGIHLGTAVGDARRGVAAHLQLAQAIVLGAVPRRLGEGLARRQPPAVLHPPQLARAALAVLRVAHCFGKGDVGLGNVRLRPRVHRDHHRARRQLGIGRLGQLDLDGGRKVAQRAQQLARIGIGRAQQALQLAGLQVGQLAKALQLQVPLQRLAHRVRPAHLHRKRGAAVRVRLDGARRRIARRLLTPAPGQQAAALQQQRRGGTEKQQRRPSGRR